MKSTTRHRLSRFMPAILAALMVVTFARANEVGTQAYLNGDLWYPDEVSSEQTHLPFFDGSGYLPGNSNATAHLSETSTGTDGNGTAGTTSLVASSSASLGHLQASTQVSASAHYAGHPAAVGDLADFYVHGTAEVDGVSVSGYQARFDDTTVVFNPDYALGALIPVEVSLFMNWDHNYDVGTTGSSFAATEAYATLSVDGAPSVSAFDGRRPDIPVWLDAPPQSIDFLVANGGSFTWHSSLGVFAEISLAGIFESRDPRDFPDMAGFAFSNASIDVTPTSGFAGTTFTSVTGYVYGSDETAPSVPDSSSTIALLGLGLGLLGFAKRRTSANKTTT